MDMQMPQYQSHKKVWALKIVEVLTQTNDLKGTKEHMLAFENKDYAPIKMAAAWVKKHKPQAGGYYVVYEDGYESFSPADSFESGNTLLGELVAPIISEPVADTWVMIDGGKVMWIRGVGCVVRTNEGTVFVPGVKLEDGKLVVQQ